MRITKAVGRWVRVVVGALASAWVVSTMPGGGVFAMNQPAAPASLPLRTIERGSQSNIDAARQIVIRAPGEWRAFWKTHNFDKPAPDVDFDKEMVVGVFMGNRPTGGYSVAITSVTERDGSLVVMYRETSPRRDAMTVQVLTFPYHIVAVPKRSGAVTFEKAQP